MKTLAAAILALSSVYSWADDILLVCKGIHRDSGNALEFGVHANQTDGAVLIQHDGNDEFGKGEQIYRRWNVACRSTWEERVSATSIEVQTQCEPSDPTWYHYYISRIDGTYSLKIRGFEGQSKTVETGRCVKASERAF